MNEDRYARMFESATDGILVLDLPGMRVVDANPYVTQLLGRSRDDMLGKTLEQLGVFGGQTEQEFEESLNFEGYARYDHLTPASVDGEKRDIELVASVFEADRKVLAQCSLRDVSDRSHRERTIRRHATALAERLRNKDEFLAMLSHELRNPLSPILNAVKILESHSADKTMLARTAGIIERQVGQLRRIVDDLLELSRINTDSLRLQRTRVHMGTVAQRAIEACRPLIEQHEHALVVSISSHPIPVIGDPGRLEQVVVNLLTNAVKYTPDDGNILLSIERDTDECVLRVRDNGVGIPPEVLPHVFEMFTQSARTLERSKGGLGIGLALVQRLVELHGGRVEATSVAGKGSEFIVRLPVDHSPEPAAPTVITERAMRSATPLRVMIVEDNLDAARSLALLLEDDGHTVKMAHDGRSALDVAPEFSPDVVMVDIGLPLMDGLTVGKHLREMFGELYLIAITGYGQEIDRMRAHDAGFNQHLVKPVRFSTVQRLLSSFAP